MALTALQLWPQGDSSLAIDLIGGSADNVLVLNRAEGFGIVKGNVLSVQAIGSYKSRVTDVIPVFPTEINLSGSFRQTPTLDTNVVNYIGAFDYLAGIASAGADYTESLLVKTDSNGVRARRVVVSECAVGYNNSTFNREFTIRLVSSAPWYNPNLNTASMNPAGTYLVNNLGQWPVYPVFRITATGGAITSLTIKNNTDGGKQVSFSGSFSLASGSTLVISMDPGDYLALVGTTQYVQYVNYAIDQRFVLLPGPNTIVTSFTGSASAFTAEWYDVYAGN